MATTIQVKEHTMQMLSALKKETKTRSYDEVINKLLTARRKKIESMYGSLKGDWDIMEGLRDKHDRY